MTLRWRQVGKVSKKSLSYLLGSPGRQTDGVSSEKARKSGPPELNPCCSPKHCFLSKRFLFCQNDFHGMLWRHWPWMTLEKLCEYYACCSEASVFHMKVSWLSRGVAKDLHGSRCWLDCLDDRDSCLCVICRSSYATVCASWARSMLPDDERAESCLPWMNAVRLLCCFYSFLGRCLTGCVCVCVCVCAGSAQLWSVPYPGVPNAPLVAVELWSLQILHWCIPCKPLSCTESRSSFQCGSWIYLRVCKSEATGIKVVRG